jgi:hypothetical protein
MNFWVDVVCVLLRIGFKFGWVMTSVALWVAILAVGRCVWRVLLWS